jgi:hypothetical protein
MLGAGITLEWAMASSVKVLLFEDFPNYPFLVSQERGLWY